MPPDLITQQSDFIRESKPLPMEKGVRTLQLLPTSDIVVLDIRRSAKPSTKTIAGMFTRPWYSRLCRTVVCGSMGKTR